jgi:hypothetical protein
MIENEFEGAIENESVDGDGATPIVGQVTVML